MIARVASESTIVSFALATWAVVAVALVRSAESRTTGLRVPFDGRALAVALVVALATVGAQPSAGRALLVGTVAIALVAGAGADARTGYLFDALTLPTAALATTLACVSGDDRDAAFGVALLVGAFGCAFILSHGRAFGLGDLKIMFSIGAAFGPFEASCVVFAASVSGIVVAALARTFRRGSAIAFGPHLALGAALVSIAHVPLAHAFAVVRGGA